MITITDARFARGHSGWDHLLDDSPLSALVGRTYRSLRAATQAATRAIRGTQDRRCANSPVTLCYTIDGVQMSDKVWA